MDYGEQLLFLVKKALSTDRVENFQVADMDKLFEEAKRHMISGLVGMVLDQSSGMGSDLAHRAVAKVIQKNILMNNELRKIFNALEKEGIWFLPLKGIVIREYYPKQYLREMSDCDILFDSERAENVKRIMEGLGYTTTSFGIEHHDVYIKANYMVVEMHRTLFQVRHQMYEYYTGIKSRLVLENGSKYRFCFKPEDFYIYMISHEYVHFTLYPGTGIRSLVDTYVFLAKNESLMDWNYIRNECRKIGISDFEERNRLLSMHLFGEGGMTERDKEMLQYFMTESVYGSTKDGVKYKVEALGGGRKGSILYILKRLFPTRRWIKQRMPFIYKYKILLFLVPFIRVWQGITTKRRVAQKELECVWNYEMENKKR